MDVASTSATTTTTIGKSSAARKTVVLDGQKAATASDSHQFPVNEEANVLGHGTKSATESAASTTEPSQLSEKQHQQKQKRVEIHALDSSGETRTEHIDDDADVDGDTLHVKLVKTKLLLDFEEAPDHLKFNPYIRSGYRTFLSTKLCLQSVFWWTNETINIWSHLCGCLLFIGLTISDFQFLQKHADVSDQVLVVCLLICFCLCMLLSSIYHIFSCKSEEHYDFFLSVDFLGIALSLVAIYISGMYYAFWCFETEHLRLIYSVIALGMFVLTMVIQIPRLNVSLDAKIVVLVAWAAYGIVPLVHWSFVMGGLKNELVGLMVPRVIIMYALCALAFIIYAAKIPERWFTGKVDFVGHSHNWWHLFILAAFYHWHNTGIVYAEYRLNNGCSLPALT